MGSKTVQRILRRLLVAAVAAAVGYVYDRYVADDR
jgi:hypothetical protein